MNEYMADGIRVERYEPPKRAEAFDPPLVLVHGGAHGAWCWEDMAPIFSDAGFDTHALNWLGRNGSDPIPDETLIKLSIADVVEDIRKVTAGFDRPPILLGHSMGAMACQLYASRYPVEALVLLTPVVPAETGTDPIEVPVDLDRRWEVPPEVAAAMFYDGVDPETYRGYLEKIVPESPRRCMEATRFSLSVDPETIKVPVLIVSGGQDRLTPPASGEALAKLYGAERILLPECGHNVLFGERGVGLAKRLVPWLRRHGTEAAR